MPVVLRNGAADLQVGSTMESLLAPPGPSCGAKLAVGGLAQEIGQQLVASLGEHTLRVELHPLEMAMLRAADVLNSVREMRIELLRLQLSSAISRLDVARANGQLSEQDHAELLAAQIRRVRHIQMIELSRS